MRAWLNMGILVGAFLAVATPAAHAEDSTFTIRHSDSQKSLIIRWTGRIDTWMPQRLEVEFERYKHSTDKVIIELDSPGGSVKAAEQTITILRYIRRTHRLETVVRQGAKCGSMCVFIYAQGKERVAALTSSWLFHEVARKSDGQVMSVNRPKWEALIETYLVPEGVSREWIAKMKPLTYRSDFWQTGKDLIDGQSGIVHVALGNHAGRNVHDGRPREPAAERVRVAN